LDLSGKRSIGLYLQIIEVQFVPADRFCTVAATCRTGCVVVDDAELIAAFIASPALPTDPGIQLQTLPVGSSQHRLKTKAERVYIDRGEFADQQPDANGPGPGMAHKFLTDRFEDRLRNG